MATYTNYKSGLISICNYESEGPGYSDVLIDYPMILGPDQVYDQIDIQMKPWGRHPVTELPLFINEVNVDRWTGVAIQNGATSLSAYITPPADHPIDASLTRLGINTAGSVASIDPDAKYLVWGMWARGNVADQEALPPALRIWWVDAEVDSERKTAFDTFMTARGTSPGVLSAYWTANPNATYRQVGQDFEQFITE